MPHKLVNLSAQDRINIAASYTCDVNPKNQHELALQYNCAPVTIRRALAEEGLIELKNHKTQKDSEILSFLQSQGLRDINKLRDFVNKARTGNARS